MGRAFPLFVAALTLVTIFRCFFGIADRPVERWDEATNIVVVRETIEKKVFPNLSLDDQPFFEKPPLWYWVSLATTSLVESSVVVFRTISAVSGFFTVLLTAGVAFIWWGPVASAVTWAVLLSTNHLFTTNAGGFFSTHTFTSADVDGLFIFLFVVSFDLLFHKPEKHTSTLAGTIAGLAVLTKGPLGFLPLVFAFALQTTRRFATRATIAAIIIVLPWYLFMTLKFGSQFLQTHIGFHLITRVVTSVDAHANSPLYYVRLLMNRNVFVSWEILLAALVWTITQGSWKKDRRIFACLLMSAACFVIPTVVATRLAWYILPFYPFAALVIGFSVADFTRRILFRLRIQS